MPTPNTLYITAESLKRSLDIDGLEFAEDDAGDAVEAASRMMDEACGRRFWLDEDNTSERLYTPDSYRCRLLMIDDIVDLVSVKIDRVGSGSFTETWVEGTQFVLGPVNADQNGKPFEQIELRRNYGAYLPCIEHAVKVTGQFGWSEVPADIKVATKVLASRYLRRMREAPFGVVATLHGDSVGAIRITKTDPDVGAIIDKYTRRRPFI